MFYREDNANSTAMQTIERNDLFHIIGNSMFTEHTGVHTPPTFYIHFKTKSKSFKGLHPYIVCILLKLIFHLQRMGYIFPVSICLRLKGFFTKCVMSDYQDIGKK